jgi:cellobiose phosphorylase
MDHGAWPFLTTKLYIDRSGDLDFLLEKQSYFRDPLMNRSKKFDENWSIEAGNQLKDDENNVYEGTLLEHILVQHLSVFFNVGKHNNLKLEGGDWNDGLDMAEDKGESVPFTALYGSNMLELAKLLKHMKDELSLESVTLAKEIKILLDTMNTPVDYSSVSEKNTHLDKYFEAVAYKVSGVQEEVLLDDLIKDLEHKGQWIVNHIRKNEWIKNKEGYAWYNAYYDNDGDRLEGDHEKGVRMTLTGQVFPIMGHVATADEIKDITKAADYYLKNDAVGGYRLNTPLNEVKLNLGRAFGFAYGEKENGAMFSHMAVMYGNALYQRSFAEKGFEVIDSIYNHCKNFEKSRIYPGIPEYIDARGRGLYHFLTGSASWLLLTMVDQVYGIQGKLGDLKLNPKLVPSQFDADHKASITTYFADRKLEITYENKNKKSVDNYTVKEIIINDQLIDFTLENQAAVIKRNIITDLETDNSHKVLVILN